MLNSQRKTIKKYARDKSRRKVRDHCHYTGTYRGPAHSICNLKTIKKVDKNGNENVVTISCKIKFIDSARFMASSLQNLVDNLAEGINKSKCKYCGCFFEYESVNDNLINYKCLSYNKNHSKKIYEQ